MPGIPADLQIDMGRGDYAVEDCKLESITNTERNRKQVRQRPRAVVYSENPS